MYFISKLLTVRTIRHGISTIAEGNMDYRFGPKAEVLKNRKHFFDQIRIPSERTVFIDVQHGTKIIKGSTSLAGTGFNSSETAIKADALVTKEKNLAIVMLTADCIPLVLYDPLSQLLGLVHLSRHNTKSAFAQIIMSFLKREYDSNPSELKVFIGPSIKKNSYILPEYPEGFDLVNENVNQLLLKGVGSENIVVDPQDTASSKDFFSHFRAVRSREPEGRFATVAMLV